MAIQRRFALAVKFGMLNPPGKKSRSRFAQNAIRFSQGNKNLLTQPDEWIDSVSAIKKPLLERKDFLKVAHPFARFKFPIADET